MTDPGTKDKDAIPAVVGLAIGRLNKIFFQLSIKSLWQENKGVCTLQVGLSKFN